MKKFILTILVLMTTLGCSLESRTVRGCHLPPGATNVKIINHNWLSFELDGQKYMYGDVSNSDSRVIFPITKETE